MATYTSGAGQPPLLEVDNGAHRFAGESRNLIYSVHRFFTSHTRPRSVSSDQEHKLVESSAMRREGPSDVIDSVVFSFGGGGWTRTNDLGIMRPSL